MIRPGQAVYDVDDRPVILFNGSTPAFRDLGPSVSAGPDVLELNRDLRRLGFDPEHLITLDDIWQVATTDAVDLWQESLGTTVTGTIALGQVAFLPGAQRITAWTRCSDRPDRAPAGRRGLGRGRAVRRRR